MHYAMLPRVDLEELLSPWIIIAQTVTKSHHLPTQLNSYLKSVVLTYIHKVYTNFGQPI